jgi:hypothetical protein
MPSDIEGIKKGIWIHGCCNRGPNGSCVLEAASTKDLSGGGPIDV